MSETLRIGSLFSGYGGLEIAAHDVLGAELAWLSDIDPASCAVMGHHYPGVPNLGDVTRVDWAQVPPVDILTGGFPCQDVSVAGARKGLREETRSGLWSEMREAVAVLRPELVIIENVGGLLSADANSEMECREGCVGVDKRGLARPLRALGRVLGDLAGLRYDASWYSVRASDVGAAHGRRRVFVFGAPADASRERLQLDRTPRVPAYGGFGDVTLLPTPGAYAGARGGAQHPDKRRAGGHSVSLGDVAAYLPPSGWGKHEQAIRRHEQALGRPAPAPTETGPRGGTRLSARFLEWLMMLPEGWVTDTPGITWREAIKALGNGVVPAQAAAALEAYLDDQARGEQV